VPSIHKSDLIKIAEAKAGDALLLLQHGRHSNAYYLSGYAVEIALKAIIATEFRHDTFPDRDFVTKIFGS
jgi:HEPN domain-containing protein